MPHQLIQIGREVELRELYILVEKTNTALFIKIIK